MFSLPCVTQDLQGIESGIRHAHSAKQSEPAETKVAINTLTVDYPNLSKL